MSNKGALGFYCIIFAHSFIMPASQSRKISSELKWGPIVSWLCNIGKAGEAILKVMFTWFDKKREIKIVVLNYKFLILQTISPTTALNHEVYIIDINTVLEYRLGRLDFRWNWSNFEMLWIKWVEKLFVLLPLRAIRKGAMWFLKMLCCN